METNPLFKYFTKNKNTFIFHFISIITLFWVEFHMVYSFFNTLGVDKPYNNFYIVLTLLVILTCTYILYRYIFFHIKKVDEGKLGIVIGIMGKTNKHNEKIEEELINNLKNDIKIKYSGFIEVIKLKDYYTEKILRSENKDETITKINEKIKGHLYIYGKLVEKKDGENKYFIETGYCVFTPNITDDYRKALKTNLNILSLNLNFNENEEHKGFLITKELLGFSSQFFLGLVLYLNGALDKSTDIFYNLLRKELIKLNIVKGNIIIIINILELIKHGLNILGRHFIDRNDFEKAEYYINMLNLNLDTNNSIISNEIKNFRYTLYLQKSMLALKNGDVDSALKIINRACKIPNFRNDKERIFSKCYLLLWKGEYIKFNYLKKKLLKEIKNISFTENFISEIERFTIDDLKINTEKYQLYFWIGFLYYEILNNYPYSLKYFNIFIEKIGTRDHFLLGTAKNYKEIIEEKIITSERELN